MQLVPAWLLGVMTLSAIVPIGVGGLISLLAIGKGNFVCRLPFLSISFAGVTFFCFVFYPVRGDECLPVVPIGLRHFPDFFVKVDLS